MHFINFAPYARFDIMGYRYSRCLQFLYQQSPQLEFFSANSAFEPHCIKTPIYYAMSHNEHTRTKNMTFCVRHHRIYDILRVMKPYSALNPLKVIVVIDMSAGVSARELLSGLFKFVNTEKPWAMRLIQLPAESLSGAISKTIDEEVDGLIVTTSADDETNAAIASANVPTVFVDVRNPLFENRATAVSFVRNDNDGIGTLGAKYLASLGSFNSFGFVPDIEQRAWSVLREKAFVRELGRRGAHARVFTGNSRQMSIDRKNLITWLKRLPKPAAVMAAYDYRATQVCEACKEAGIRIPEQVAIVGVDNDELLCLSTTPSLSSIKPDHVSEGIQAAAELNRLLRLGKRAKRRELFCHVQGIVERESTKAGPPAATLIRRAIALIDENSRTNLMVGSVAARLGVSRRLLERRFREVRGESIHAYILAHRLTIVKHLLRTTKRSIAKIASECGFPSANSLSHIFARSIGCSMREYRNSAMMGMVF